jgi:hypothetical protein
LRRPLAESRAPFPPAACPAAYPNRPRHDGLSAHRIEIGQGVSRGDPAENAQVIHHAMRGRRCRVLACRTEPPYEPRQPAAD